MLIFISYPHSDYALANSIAAICREFGHEPFIAEEEAVAVLGGHGHLMGLCSMIDRCDAFILCMGETSVKSHFQHLEWNYALCQGKETPFIVYRTGCCDHEATSSFAFSANFHWCPIDVPAGLTHIRKFFEQRSTNLPDEERFQRMQQISVDAGLRLIARYGGGELAGPPMPLDDEKNCATNFDVDIQSFILSALNEHYAGEPCLAEEDFEKRPGKWNGDPEAEWIWTVDAIDGTLNFLAGDERYCCGIGLLRHGKPYFGAVFVPSQMLLYSGGVGRPATVRNLRDGTLHNLQTDKEMKALSNCWTLTHINSRPDEIARCFTDDLPRRLHECVRRVWMWGCGLVALTAVARGTHHLFVQRVIWPWDIVPGLAIVHAAGGASSAWPSPDVKAWRFTGEMTSDVIVACNPDILGASAAVLGVSRGSP